MRYIALLIPPLALLFACGGKPAAETVVPGTTIELPIEDLDSYIPDTIKMGRMAEGEVIKGDFTLHNMGEKPVVIATVITGCGCTTAKYDKDPIMQDGKRTIEFVFDSKGRYGRQKKTIEVITAENEVIPVILTGDVQRKQ